MPASPNQIDVQVEELIARQTAAFEAYSKQVLSHLQNVGKKYTKTIEEGTEKQKRRFDDNSRRLSTMWNRYFQHTVLGFEGALRDMTRLAGSQGGFGQVGVELGKKIGGGIGDTIGKKIGGKAGMLGRAIGTFVGGGIVTAVQTSEAIRMLGARFAPVATGGMGVRSDYRAIGGEIIRQTNAIRLATGASKEEIMGLATELSRLGVPFDQAGSKATQYALASEKVLNLERGTTAALDTLAITKYGEAWDDVAGILQNITSSTAQWQHIARKTGSSLAQALSSNQNLTRMYMEVASAVSNSSLSMKGLSEVFLASTNAMGNMGLRPGMMADVNREFMSKLTPKTGGFMNMVSQGYFIQDVLARTTKGMQFLAGARGVAEQMHLDPNLITLPLNQMLASNDANTKVFFRAMLEGVGMMRDMGPGRNITEKTTQALFRLEGTFGISPMAGQVMMTMADQYRDQVRQGKTPDEAWAAVGQSREFQQAATQAGMQGKSPEEVLKIASGMGEASLSAQDKLTMAMENLATKTNDLATWMGVRMGDTVANMLNPKQSQQAVPPATPTPVQGPQEEFQPIPPEGPVMQPPGGFPKTRVGGYTKATARGTEQVNMMLEDRYFEKTRANRNRNPLNIKASAATMSYPGVVGVDPVEAKDSGYFLRFESPEAGFAAAERLLQTPGYSQLPVGKALERWSNRGYGGDVAMKAGIDPGRRMASLTEDERQQLVQAMATREGYKPGVQMANR